MHMIRHIASAAVILAALAGGAAQATIVVLNDLNSEARFDTDSKKGLFSWVVDGVEQGNRQWFWYRVGDTGPEEAINLLTQTGIVVSDGNLNPGDDRLTVGFAGSGFSIELDFVLGGSTAGSGHSTLTESITILSLFYYLKARITPCHKKKFELQEKV